MYERKIILLDNIKVKIKHKIIKEVRKKKENEKKKKTKQKSHLKCNVSCLVIHPCTSILVILRTRRVYPRTYIF